MIGVERPRLGAPGRIEPAYTSFNPAGMLLQVPCKPGYEDSMAAGGATTAM